MTLRRPRRVDGFEYRGPNRYLLTFCTSNRKRLFINTPLIADVFHEFRRTADDEAFEQTEEMIRYILDNPVRARLVERWEQYAHSGTMFPLV